MDDLDTLCGRMRWARALTKTDEQLKSLSGREMSRRAGLSDSMWGLLESGEKAEPSASTMDALAILLGVTTDWIIARRGNDPSPEHVRAAIASHAPRQIEAADPHPSAPPPPARDQAA